MGETITGTSTNPNGDSAKAVLSDQVINKIDNYFNREKKALFLHINKISDKNDGLNYVSPEAVCSQLAGMYVCEIVRLDAQGNVTENLDETVTTAIAISPADEHNKAKYKLSYQNNKNHLPEDNSKGKWEDKNKRGNSRYKFKDTAKLSNYPRGKETQWGEDTNPKSITGIVKLVMNRHNNDDHFKNDLVQYVNDYPNFDNCNLGEVNVDFYSTDRKANFRRADELMAEKLTKNSNPHKEYTAEDVKAWMEKNNVGENGSSVRMTWHETADGRLQKVPTILHANVPHKGGVHEEKSNANKRHNLEKGKSREITPTSGNTLGREGTSALG